MAKQIFNIVFNSDIGTGLTPNDAFYFDWSRMPDVPYHVSFSFTSAVATLTNTTVANIFVDLGCSNTFLAGPTSGNNALSSIYLGSFRATGTGASNYLVSAEPDNPPIYLRGRPTNNSIVVQIHQNIITQMTDYAPAPVKYTLCLCFRAVE